jgi:hypothetical protein
MSDFRSFCDRFDAAVTTAQLVVVLFAMWVSLELAARRRGRWPRR